jgi:hypothetical protein
MKTHTFLPLIFLAFGLLSACAQPATPAPTTSLPPITGLTSTATSAPTSTSTPLSTATPTVKSHPTEAVTFTPTLQLPSVTPAAELPPFPVSLLGASLAYDRTRKEVVLFGGTDPLTHEESNETWTWDGEAWTLQRPSTSPPKRQGGSLAYDPTSGNMLLFGGFSFQKSDAFADTWIWDGQDWTELHPTVSPPPRINPGMAADLKRKEIVLFGGIPFGRAATAQNDTWIWDGNKWRKAIPPVAPPAIPDPPLAFDSSLGQVVLSASFEGSGKPNDLWTWDGETWKQISAENAPSARYDEAIAYDESNQALAVFGGIDARLDSQSEFLTDTWFLESAGWKQAQKMLPGINLPPQSSVVCPALLKEKGGAEMLSSIIKARMLYDVARQHLLLFTINREQPPRFMQWIWDGESWQKQIEHAVPLPPAEPPGEGWVRIPDGNLIRHEDKVTLWLNHFLQPEVALEERLVDFKFDWVDGPYGPTNKKQEVAYRIYKVQVAVKPFIGNDSLWNDGNGEMGPDGWITGKELVLGEWYQDASACDTWMKEIK